MLYYAPQTWTSDDTDAVERMKIQYGTSFVYPLSSMGAHVSAVPNHQVRRVTSLDLRGHVAFFGVLGYELDVTKLTDQEKEIISNQISFYKENRELIYDGTFYRIHSPFEGSGNVTCWMVVSEDQSHALVGYYQILAEPNPGYKSIRLKGLNETAEYRIDGVDGTYFGDELMNVGLQLPNEFSGSSQSKSSKDRAGDFRSELFKLTLVR